MNLTFEIGLAFVSFETQGQFPIQVHTSDFRRCRPRLGDGRGRIALFARGQLLARVRRDRWSHQRGGGDQQHQQREFASFPS